MRPIFKTVLISFVLLMSSGVFLFAQPDRIGAGLSFSNVLDFNTGETSNPGFLIKTWIAIDKKKKMHIVPTITAYNRYKYESGVDILTNYMFQGDIDIQYAVFQEKTVKVIAFVGGNYTYLLSKFEVIPPNAGRDLTDDSKTGPLAATLVRHLNSGCLITGILLFPENINYQHTLNLLYLSMLRTFSRPEADNTEAGADVRGDRWLEKFSYLYSLLF